jgi:hypothetical protein
MSTEEKQENVAVRLLRVPILECDCLVIMEMKTSFFFAFSASVSLPLGFVLYALIVNQIFYGLLCRFLNQMRNIRVPKRKETKNQETFHRLNWDKSECCLSCSKGIYNSPSAPPTDQSPKLT